MKKILTSTLLAATVLGAGLAVSGSASAADSNSTIPDTANTAGSVTFVPGEGTNPIDPNPTDPDPTDPGDGGGGETGHNGPLAIVYATKAVSFGLDESKDGNYAVSKTVPVSAKAQELKGSNFVSLQVGDVRGTSAGWTLSVSANQFKSVKSGDLVGAALFLGEGDNEFVGGAAGKAATAHELKDAVGAGGTVLDAGAGKGAGLNADKIRADKMTLTIPAGSAQAEAYTTTLNWSLSAVPGV
ncbi:WxL domain-containing protein [Dellaglioa algida]|uniref:WxL domain-containing protein n=1 Tax=Dellaglioa algida TaxID=105612 RepID=UPI000BCBF554|nr:WxL domain-containing protein [Dellaglioa algida]MDK1718959.1 WxL domain-containing protein [Dellaglioa algida]MDK1730113.1 WxL domain-containing protein [Dellaglioa algida]MDK1742547.1 WxL domain-containing protein [Dellaglioa algida]SOB51557.1 putative Cell surface protein [Dellaglioa algida]